MTKNATFTVRYKYQTIPDWNWNGLSRTNGGTKNAYLTV